MEHPEKLPHSQNVIAMLGKVERMYRQTEQNHFKNGEKKERKKVMVHSLTSSRRRKTHIWKQRPRAAVSSLHHVPIAVCKTHLIFRDKQRDKIRTVTIFSRVPPQRKNTTRTTTQTNNALCPENIPSNRAQTVDQQRPVLKMVSYELHWHPSSDCGFLFTL